MKNKHKTMTTRNVTPGAGGTLLEVRKYEAVKRAILKVVPRNKQGIPFGELAGRIAPLLPSEMLRKRGSASWLATTVKLDLEARGLIERVPGVRPQHLRRKAAGSAQKRGARATSARRRGVSA